MHVENVFQGGFVREIDTTDRLISITAILDIKINEEKRKFEREQRLQRRHNWKRGKKK